MTKQYVLSESEYMEIKCAIIDIRHLTSVAEPSYIIGEIERKNDMIRKIWGIKDGETNER